MQAFAMDAAAVLHLDELARHIPYLDDGLLYFSIVMGLLCCFFGWRLRRLWFSAVCLVFGCFVGSELFSREILEINLAVGAALLAAVLFVFTHRLVAPELAFCLSYCLLTVTLELPISTAIFPCLALAIAAVFFGRWVVTGATAVFGACLVVDLLPRLPLWSNRKLPFLSLLTPEHREYFIALAVLALLGFLCQCRFGSRDSLA